jgi:2-polyprenyl-3-methyl-5-hydroxy-6-metoxy-1,4-benzoquinol methylase
MFINTKYRSEQSEIMDDFAMEGEVLRNALDKIAQINQLLGGNGLTLQGVQQLVQEKNAGTEIFICDVGCGNGDMLRILADFAKENNFNFRLLGIDANEFTLNHARELSKKYSNISFKCQDVFDESFKDIKYDIILCTLTLHHFNKAQIFDLMTTFDRNCSIGVIINDLQRSALAYRLFQLLCFVFQFNTMSKNDGLVSILRGFKKHELIDFSKKLNFKHYTIKWRWAFRYQWIIEKLDVKSGELEVKGISTRI